MKKVLIITYSFPPLNNIAARRFGDLCRHMNNYGWDPYVLTTNNIGDLEVPIPETKIIRVGQHPQKGSLITKKQPSNGILGKVNEYRRKSGFNLKALDSSYFRWFKQIKKLNIGKLKNNNFDLIITSFGPSGAFYAGRYLAKQLEVPLIADFRDLAALHKEYYFKKNKLFTLLDLYIEKHLLKNVVAITTVSNGLKKEIEKNYKVPVQVIYNGWEMPRILDKINNEVNKIEPYIHYAGRLYKHRMNSLYILIEALVNVDLKLKLRSLGPVELNEQVILFAKQKGIEKQVIILPPADQAVIEEESNSAMINLVIEDLDKTYEWKKGTLTGKFLPLLIKKASVLAIAREDSEIGNILKETKKGELHSHLLGIRSFLDTEIKMTLKYCGDREKIRYYSKEIQAKILCSFLDEYVKNSLKENLK